MISHQHSFDLVHTRCLVPLPTGCSITGAVTVLGNKLRDYQGQFNITHLLALCDYFHNTFIRHYKLYQYVFGHDQEVNLTVTQLEVCVPPQPLPLSHGKDRAVWQHEQQVAELDTAEVQKRANMLLLKEALRVERERRLQRTFPETPAQQSRVLKREVRPSLPCANALSYPESVQAGIRCTARTLLFAQMEGAREGQTIPGCLPHSCMRFTKHPCEV